MQLNCKVIKKWLPPISTSTPPFQSYPPFLAKFLVPPSDSIFGMSCPPFNKGGEVPTKQFFNKHFSTSFGWNLYKILERTIWVKPHSPMNSFLINVWEHQEIYEVSWKFVLDPWKRLIYIRSLKGQYGLNCIVSSSEFARNIG